VCCLASPHMWWILALTGETGSRLSIACCRKRYTEAKFSVVHNFRIFKDGVHIVTKLRNNWFVNECIVATFIFIQRKIFMDRDKFCIQLPH